MSLFVMTIFTGVPASKVGLVVFEIRAAVYLAVAATGTLQVLLPRNKVAGGHAAARLRSVEIRELRQIGWVRGFAL
jgi:hypothetical protein